MLSSLRLRRFLLPVIVLVACAGLLAIALMTWEPNTTSRSSEGGSIGTVVDGDRQAEPGASPVYEPAVVPNDASAEDRAVTESAGAQTTAGDSGIAPSDPAPATAPNLGTHIARTASMELRIKRGSFERAWGDANAVAGAFGGYVAGASRSGAGDGPRLGTVTIQVPSRRFDAAVDRLRDGKGATVSQLDISSEDVTQEYVDTRSRLRHNRAVEDRLLALLADTNGVSEVLAVQARLDTVQEAIEVATGRLEQLKAMTSMSTIAVTLREPGAKAGAKEEPRTDDSSIVADGWADARERFATNVASIVAWTGGAAPVLLLILLVGITARTAWGVRNRRIASAEQAPPAQT